MDNPFYHGSISKKACEDLLSKRGKDGCYLIRDSETIAGALCLCVFMKRIVYTYRILQNHSGYYTLQTCSGLEEKFFKNLKEMISYYEKPHRGLIIHLRYPVKRKKTKLIKHEPEKEPEYANQLGASMQAEPTYEEITDDDYVDVLP
ncbi:SH2 domain-containing protein 1B [Polypterus senegalus]|uniref:SH2 domain-containing protein 1B n=1 Tax=Polypterus senegalus TaxID=55291 RepID=UPI0019625C54|nr:SH2 domain-containing protein 1B [Polypterus senegalus]